MKFFDFGAFQKVMKMLSREEILFLAKEFEFHSLLECDSFQTSTDIFTDFGRCCGATGIGCSTEPSSRDELVF